MAWNDTDHDRELSGVLGEGRSCVVLYHIEMTPAASSIAASAIVDWDAIDTVLVDMDGTLLDLNFDTFFWREVVPRRYASLHNLTVPAAQAALAPRFEAKVGTLEWYCLDHWASDLGLDLKTLKHEHREHIQHFVDQGFTEIYVHNVGRNQDEFIRAYGNKVIPNIKWPVPAAIVDDESDNYCA